MKTSRLSAAEGTLLVLIVTVGLMIGLSAQTSPSWDNATWKINMAKSNYNPASLAPQSEIAKREPVEGGYKVTLDTVDAQGKTTHTVTIGKYDGKDNPIQGAQPPGQTRSYKLIAGGYENVLKVDGKVATTGRFLLSSDGKTLTQTQTGKNAQGQTVNHTVIWEKQ